MRQRVELANHIDWRLERTHTLGTLSLDEMADGLPSVWQEFLASWDIDNKNVLLPVYDGPKIDPKEELKFTEEFHADDKFGKPSHSGALLRSGYWMDFGVSWNPFIDKWLKAVCKPVYGFEMSMGNLGVALITNINLFKMALKYRNGR